MTLILFFLICFSASIIGAICGIGGGVIIKPLLDMTGMFDVVTISFLSGCTVLAMTSYSVVSSILSGHSRIHLNDGFPLALGASIGGVIGKGIFSLLVSAFSNKGITGAIQSVCLFAVTAGILIYTINRKRIKGMQIKKKSVSMVIGLTLGIISAFLGIGGGPLNLAVLYFFFSMSSKEAAENSLYVIFFSQLASLCAALGTDPAHGFQIGILIVMVAGGIGGAVFGRKISEKIQNTTIDRLSVGLMVIIMGLSLYNMVMYLK